MDSFPEKYKYSLIHQICKSSLSVMSNIAEGSALGSDANFLKFLNISMGSLCELESQIIASFDLEIIDHDLYTELSNEIEELKKMIIGFIKSVKKKNKFKFSFWIVLILSTV
jgi:four helix bundle protein